MNYYTWLLAIFCVMSLLGSLVVFLSFLVFRDLTTGLFPRIILYTTISITILTIGIFFTGPLQYLSDSFCKDFSIVRIFGQLSAIYWNIILMWQEGMLFKDLYLLYQELGKQEYKLLMLCYIVPFIFTLWPAFSNDVFKDDDVSKVLCFIQSDQNASLAMIINIDIQKIVIWDAPVMFYFGYSIFVLYQLKQVFQQEEYEVNIEVTHLIKQLMIFPLITFICTIGYTVQELLLLFIQTNNVYELVVDSWLLSLWGFFFSLQFLYLHGIKDRLKNESYNSLRKNQDQDQQEVTLIEQNQNLGESSFYYKDSNYYSGSHLKYNEILANQRNQINESTNVN